MPLVMVKTAPYPSLVWRILMKVFVHKKPASFPEILPHYYTPYDANKIIIEQTAGHGGIC